ncbi:MAG TPA: Pr6Pr family membrane protein [Glaciihabitans sp.]|nr:Pr6Pr family membrane protein [Glaciihabitans sp.]
MTQLWESWPLQTDTSASKIRALQRFFAVLRLLMALVVVVSIGVQVVDLATHNAFVPGRYFTFFTIQASLICVAVLVVSALVGLAGARESPVLGTLRLAAVIYSLLAGVVFALLLRSVPSEGYVGIQWPNEVLHIVLPTVLLIDWLCAPGRRRLPWSSIWGVVSYPTVWVVFVLVHAALTGWQPYPFLVPREMADAPAREIPLTPGGQTLALGVDAYGGYGVVAIHILLIAAGVISVTAGAVLVTRLSSRPPRYMDSDPQSSSLLR